jgi:integrase
MRAVGPARTPGERDGLTKAQAEERFRKMRDAELPHSTTERVTIAVAGEELCRRLEMRGRKKSHRLTVASDLRNHIAPFFAGKDLDKIEPRDIERYVVAKLKTLSPKTVRNHLGTMHSLFELGQRNGWCQSNPVKLADRPVIKSTDTRIKFLEQPELERLLATPYPADAFGSLEPTLYLTAAMTGLRQGELLGLRWRDVDFEAKRLRVVSPYVRGEFGDPKSEGSWRSVPLASRVVEALTQLRERSAYAHDSELVFAHPESGNPLDRSKLVRRFKQATERADVRQITFHELRHSSARAWPRAAWPCVRSSTGWATRTRRRRRSTRTTSRRTRRRRWLMRRSLSRVTDEAPPPGCASQLERGRRAHRERHPLTSADCARKRAKDPGFQVALRRQDAPERLYGRGRAKQRGQVKPR